MKPRNLELCMSNAVAYRREVQGIEASLRDRISARDIRFLQLVDWTARAMRLLGVGISWTGINPIAILLIALAQSTQFMIAHHVGHGAYDRLKDMPDRLTRRGFARGWRRFVDWPTWWPFEAWCHYHNFIHHAHTATPDDLDQVETRLYHRLHPALRPVALALAMCLYQPLYYGPKLWKSWRSMTPDPSYRVRAWHGLALGDPDVRAMWRHQYIPMIFVRFVLPVVILGLLVPHSAPFVLANLVVAEVLHSAHAYLCNRPSHAGRDVPVFADAPAGVTEHVIRETIASVNYRKGGTIRNILCLFTNYQIEHHLWVWLPMSQLPAAREGVEAAATREKIPYLTDSIWRRFLETAHVQFELERQPLLDTKILRE